MDTTERSLLAAILADPLDDTPRLVMADWLESRGDVERAEFIRVQIELATYGEYSCKSSVLEHTAADSRIEVGDYLEQDQHGRLVRANCRYDAIGVALSRMDANNQVRIRLFEDSTVFNPVDNTPSSSVDPDS